MIRVTIQDQHLILPVRVTPRGGKDAFLPWRAGDEWVKVKVSAPPEDGKANAALVEFFAKALKLPKSAVSIISGETSRLKRLQLVTHEPDTLLQTLADLLDSVPETCFTR